MRMTSSFLGNNLRDPRLIGNVRNKLFFTPNTHVLKGENFQSCLFRRTGTAFLSSAKLAITSKWAPKLTSLPTRLKSYHLHPPVYPFVFIQLCHSHTNVVFQQILNGFYFTHLHTKMNPFLHKNSPQCHYFYWWLQTIYCAIIKHGLFLRDCEFEHSLPINSLFYHTPLEITKKNNIRSEAHTYTHSCQGAIL